MKNFNWDKFRESNVVVHCDTEEKANDFLKQCHEKGMTWIYGDILLEENMWYDYEENTCYDYNNNNIFYCSLNYYKNNKCQVIEWEI